MSKSHELSNFIWSIADLLRGPYSPPQYERVMLPLVVLLRFDCVFEKTKFDVLKKHELYKDKYQGEALDSILNKASGQQFSDLQQKDESQAELVRGKFFLLVSEWISEKVYTRLRAAHAAEES
ncbi:type I restriction-modification system subunit M N-terminal domain-containing protein [Desulfobacula sp.]|uniref:type I restriction-modification system subunit M N-terminal domain-containing protein n=1 Tax=Desulfobacula sp. TaxID=2593537 RepID=UPI002637FACF|nr:type I restriction-modification system subunit M N-terminal domain-containing protein [Desulfobacula sp.]